MVGTFPSLSFEEVDFFNLSNNGLFGSLSGLNLPKVKSFNITDSKLNGNLTDFDFSKPTLEEIRLQFSQLSGPIPDFSLPNLRVLDLGGNKLSGELPALNTPNLEILSFGGNKTLIGSIPLYILPKVNTLYFQDNKFDGSIPPFDMPLLKLLWLNNNNLSGCIPSIFKQNCGVLNNVQLASNILLMTDSWDDFCANNDGICFDCFTPVIADKFKAILVDIFSTVNILEGGEIPDTFSIEIINIKNDIFATKNLSENGDFSFSFKEHFFGSVEVEFEICGLPCKACTKVKLIITDEYVPIIVPTK